MKLTIPSSDLKSALADAGHALLRSNKSAAIFDCVLIEAGDGKLRVTATDMDKMIRVEREATVTRPGSAAVNAARLGAWVAALNPGQVEIEHADGSMTCRSSRSRITIATMDPAEFPSFGAVDAEHFEIDAQDLAKLIGMPIPACDQPG